MIPLYHDFRDATVLVFGGGSVGSRKARRFAREADVVVISPTFDDRFDEPALADVERIRAAPEPADVDEWVDRFEPALVVAATDNAALNAAVDTAASERGLLINRTDRPSDWELRADGNPERTGTSDERTRRTNDRKNLD